MEIKEMTIEDLQTRLAAIPEDIEKDGADLDALEAEVKAIKAELEARKAEAAKKAEIRSAVAAGAVETTVVKDFKENEERKVMTNAEVRKSHEYNVAYAEYAVFC